MKNNEAPFVISQQVICVVSSKTLVKDKKYRVEDVQFLSCCKMWVVCVGVIGQKLLLNHCSCGSLHRFDNPAIYHESGRFAPIREVRDHKSVAVPEELLHIKESDVLEPVKIKI